MIKKTLILFFFSIVAISYGQTVQVSISKNIQERDGKQFYVHQVSRGQTVYSIAKAYHVGIDEIYYSNPEARQGIKIGQSLWIPTENKETEITKEVKQSTFDFFYHVAAGKETIAHISSIYLIPQRYILLANPGLQEPLKEGEYVKIPVESAFPVLDGKVNTTASNSTHYRGGLSLQKPKPAVSPETFSKPYSVPTNKEKSYPIKTKEKSNFNPATPVIKDYRHVVVMGETLESIAKKYAIGLKQLKMVNPGLLVAIQGQRLRLPVTAKVPGYHPTASSEKSQTEIKANPNPKNYQPQQQVGKKEKLLQHTVKRKETLYSISRAYGVSLDELYQANPGLSSKLKVGQIIQVPKKKINKPYLLYTSFQKMTLKKIARLYRMGVDLLKRKNPTVGKRVSPGQAVKIPIEVKTQAESLVSTEEEPTAKPVTTVAENAAEAAANSRCQPRPHTKSFKVALMIPLYLEETDSLNHIQFMSQSRKNFEPFRFVRFLEGALLASDSLQKQGMKLQLFVYDVDQKLTKASKVLSQPELKNMDLIIGPFYSRSFAQIALFATHFHIPIINPLTFRNEVIQQNNQVIKVKPDITYESGLIKKLISNEYMNNKIFLIPQTAYNNTQIIDQLRDSIQAVIPPTFKISNQELIEYGVRVTQREKDQEQAELEEKENAQEHKALVQITVSDTLRTYLLENQVVNPELLKQYPEDSTQFDNSLISIHYATDSIHPFENYASMIRKNLVILYGENKSFIMDAMNRLNLLRDTFQIQMIGLPLWENFSDLDLQQMNNLSLTYPSSYYVNYQSLDTKQYEKLFQNTYSTDPKTYGILGFDIAYYFINSLYLYGNRMIQCMSKNPQQGLSTRFQFAPANLNNHNFENTYWNLLRIKNQQLFKLPDLMYEGPDNK